MRISAERLRRLATGQGCATASGIGEMVGEIQERRIMAERDRDKIRAERAKLRAVGDALRLALEAGE